MSEVIVKRNPIIEVSVSDADLTRLEFIAGLRKVSVEELLISTIQQIPTPANRACEMCSTLFIVEDPRQIYCGRKCLNRSKNRRRQERQADLVDPPDDVEYMTIAEAARQSGVHPNTIRYWIEAGKIGAMETGLGKVVSTESFMQWAEDRKHAPIA